MRLSEITKTVGQAGIPTEITDFLEKYEIHNKNYTVRPNGIVDLKFSATISPYASHYVSDDSVNRGVIEGKLPVKFGKVKGSFSVFGNNLTTLENCPEWVGADFNCGGNSHLTSLEFLPRHIGRHCQIVNTGITSLVGIGELVDHIGGEFYFDAGKIKEGGIGLLMIDGLRNISGTSDSKITPPFKIIKKYLGKPDEVFECQQELIDAGYEAYAEL